MLPAHNSARHRSFVLLALLTLGAAHASAQLTWSQRSPATVPTARRLMGFAYDSARARTLMFGGISPESGETWEWDGTDWTLRSPSASPEARRAGQLAYDSTRGRVVLFGGVKPFVFFGDTWEWDGTTWTQRASGGPSPRHEVGMAYDSVRQKTVMFGGYSASGFLDETWEWDGTSWTQISLAVRPGVRYAEIAYDPTRQRIVMFGGWSGSAILDDTWEYDGVAWTLRSPTVRPAARYGHRMIYHAGRQRVMLLSGVTSAGYAADVWEWDGSNWQQVMPLANHGPRSDFGAAYDSVRNRVVMFGGIDDAGLLNQTWELGEQSSGPGVGPRDVELLDLDGDGDLDVATANEGSNNVSLRSNNGQGVLAAEATLGLTAADTAPVALARGDLDNDGARDDLVVVCETSSTVVLITNPTAASPGRTSLGVAGLRPACVACGDLDGNPLDDVVVGRQGEVFGGGGGIALILNGGAATSLTIPAPHPTQVVKVALGDLDGDGDLDLAAVAQGSSDEVLLFAGNGAGVLTFAGALPLTTSGLASSLCLTDIDGDGRQDLAVVQPVLFPPAQSLRVYRRTSSGALAAGLFVAGSDITTSGTFAVDLASGDLEQDSISGFYSRVDLAQANAGSGTVTINHGYSSGAFATSSSPTAGSNPVAVAVGDLNGDGCDDVVVANQGSDNVTVLLTTPPALAQTYGTGCGGPTIAAVGSPTLGNAAFGVRVSNARPVAPVLLLFAAAPADVLLAPSTCRLLLSAPISQLLVFSNGSGQATLTFGVPNTSSLRGVDVFFQGAVFRSPGGAFADVLDFSDALRVQVGQ